jgi:hypothetical protein
MIPWDLVIEDGEVTIDDGEIAFAYAVGLHLKCKERMQAREKEGWTTSLATLLYSPPKSTPWG